MKVEIVVKGITCKYFGGHHSKFTAQAQAEDLRRQGHLAIIRHDTTAHFPWIVYWHDRTPRRQNIYW